MSIPPLVCSTPPPPDQCEEDKDPDDFVISYDLSQDDDDDGFNYGGFSSYNHYQSNCSPLKNETLPIHIEQVIKSAEKEVGIVINQENKLLENENTAINNQKPKCDEDITIEDLGLKVNEESLISDDKNNEKYDTEYNYNISNSDKVLDVAEDGSDESNSQSNPSEENIVTGSSLENVKDSLDDPVDDSSIDLDALPSEPISSNEELSKNDELLPEIDELQVVNEPNVDSNLDGDFGDYDDFQFVSSGRKPSDVIENCDNPWDTGVVAEVSDFGNFTANFEAADSQICPDTTGQNTKKDPTYNLDLKGGNIAEDDNYDDDFGEFDDFKSAIEKTNEDNSEDLPSGQNLPVLNFNMSDNEIQIIENISKALSSIFEEELTQPEAEFEGKLESTLSETWRHLRETDVRQPYIVNWNNSLGQKTLLKALCIDSRNILFGPKWSYNMPKYAVNLGAAPLQPQKPVTPFTPSQAEVTTNKTTPKPGDWTDPFTADGQESCSTENETVVEVTANDLDVFEAGISRKSDKIYSSTLNVQPLRQISLPDTHIFTPTDSETPTSKTVHYSNGPTLLPQASLEDTGPSSIEPKNNTPIVEKDDDYWEFQDFKSSSDKTSSLPTTEQEQRPDTVSDIKSDNIAVKPNITYQTQVLQPMKMEPLMPTVNWPDPGEIKETFDDFTDFVSNSAWNDKKLQISNPQRTPPEKKGQSLESLVVTNSKHKNDDEDRDKSKAVDGDVDDEFDTFQSALPTKHISSENNFDNLDITFNDIPQQKSSNNINQSSQIADFTAFPSPNNIKSENISVNSVTKSREGLASNLNPSNTSEIYSSKNSNVGNTSHNTLLQPMSSVTNSASSQSKQTSKQILHPMSLESFSQINWPNPGIDLQDLSRFNPVETVHSLKTDLSVGGTSKASSPAHSQKNAVNSQALDDDWGDFVSSKPKQTASKKPASFVDDDEWTDFVSSPNVKPQNGLNTISLNVHTSSNIQKISNQNKLMKSNQIPHDIPTLNYITPKTSGNKSNDRHFQNL